MIIPEHLFYSRDHEWIRFDGDTAFIGITEFAQKELGDIVFIEVETVGNSIAAGEVFGTIEAVKTVSDLFIPVKGTVLELNPKIGTAPELVNSDPYGEGWIIKIKPHLAGDTKNLLTALEYGDVIAMH